MKSKVARTMPFLSKNWNFSLIKLNLFPKIERKRKEKEEKKEGREETAKLKLNLL